MNEKENKDTVKDKSEDDFEEENIEKEDTEKLAEEDKNIKVEEKNEIEETFESVKEELESSKEKLLRSLAENENIRKQMEKSRHESIKYGAQPLARELLSVVDNFERALPKSNDEKKEPILEGFHLIKKEIKDILEKFNVKKISALGENFDANYHQAMFEKETKEYKPGIICEIIQDGYLFHDRLLRPSLVAVSKKYDKEAEEKNTENIEKSEKKDIEKNTSTEDKEVE